MIKLALLLKFSLLGSVALAVIAFADTLAAEALGIPHSWQLLFNGFVAGWVSHAVIGSYVGGMVPPDKKSTRGYIHYFHTLHLMFHRSTAFLGRISIFENLLGKGDDEGKQ
jgi:hypothetical protein